MDIVLNFADHYIFTPYVYPARWEETDPLRQYLSLLVIVMAGGYLLYLSTASLGYLFLFDKRLLQHPQMLKDQVKLEIQYACWSVPYMSLPTCVMFLLEVRGYSKLYDNIDDTSLGYLSLARDAILFLFFTDMLIYWIHRGLHHRLLYKTLHKPHHKWKVPTPFASHAFHPLDGFAQSFPYHLYPFLFPLHKGLYLGLFLFVNVWTVSIHDGDFRVPDTLKPIVNGSAHHTDHHLFFDYNYGQFFTLWDRIGGSFRAPSAWEGKAPIDDINRMGVKAKQG
ncbi:lathosterol oxidase-like [Branchiostoma lanceolatum]|uniref:lathosterol oxidase-like n=1 Tax=Branchiostoma lanceolatum TaxID=7740 RepID=UPI003452080B